MKKQQKKKNPFKVDHVRSIKLKAKAKQYKGQLKQINKAVVSDKIKTTNDQLSSIQDIVRQTSQKNESTSSDKISVNKDVKVIEEERRLAVENYRQLEMDQTKTLDKLSTWKC